jgi:putative tryptophan/tyrosine transport system substrate-binding protein
MKRRDFITLLGGTAAVWPIATRAQQGDRRRVGIFMDLGEQDREGQTRVTAFREGMQKTWLDRGS